jgi:small GTP-binding protein
MDLKEYEQEKFAIADIIRSAQAVDTKDQISQSECRDLLTRLAEDRFNLLVVGRFSRGKSTLMNALLGGDHLPTGIVPLTSVITTVRYGSRKQVVLTFNDRSLRREVPLSQLAEYVTQQSNPGNVKNVAYAEIELPVEILRRGFFFVDSPGLGSSITENTQTTERFLPQADAFVLVTSYESPLSEEEDRILHRIRLTNKKLFVVVNKQDTVSVEERREALAFVVERLQRFSFSETPRVYSLSARQGLHAKQSGDRDLLDESGLGSFEAELLRFLTEERAQSFLSNMYGRVTAFLAQRLSPEGQAGHEESFNRLVGRLRTLREKELGADAQSGEAVASEEESSPAAILQIEKRTGCWICAAVLDAIFGFLSKYQYELTINPETQREHASRGGFCPLHTWQYENISSPYGVCTAYPQLAHRIAGELERLAAQTSDANRSLEDLNKLLATAEICRVCEIRIEAEKKAVNIAAAAVRDAAVSGGERLPACCLPHLALVVASLGDGQPARNLLHAHARLLERTAEDLQRYALRHDALRRYLTSEEERRASQLALLLLAGHRSVNAPWAAEFIA